ncbi:type IV conjugative transfer system protein TraE [Endozoicomonas gorgoniicola]|uniref:Type IV conjugative transfer system protein TraE n=1 Tax=Endozoicomonas gorgoniicola TaxID=1234144 RepID=A0ABT3MU24_9GAMM|nr:type IV conjugative transfer system protein TraE [Endozoicomonas gorgoniicola]MCW7552892.1 type IV conjugative transfer system protein TraE [Endozoicomonas gorgoniicola]
MTITDYLQRFKEWRQRLCMDRLILLVLVVTNALLIAHCLSRKPTVELLLPFMETQAGVHSGEASVAYHEWWGLSLAELLGNLNQQNLSFVESRLQSLFAPNLYQQVQDTLNRQFRQLREDRVSMSFEPLSIEFIEESKAVKVTGNAVMSSGNQRLKGQKTFTFRFDIIRYRPVLAAIQIDSNLK